MPPHWSVTSAQMAAWRLFSTHRKPDQHSGVQRDEPQDDKSGIVTYRATASRGASRMSSILLRRSAPKSWVQAAGAHIDAMTTTEASRRRTARDAVPDGQGQEALRPHGRPREARRGDGGGPGRPHHQRGVPCAPLGTRRQGDQCTPERQRARSGPGVPGCVHAGPRGRGLHRRSPGAPRVSHRGRRLWRGEAHDQGRHRALAFRGRPSRTVDHGPQWIWPWSAGAAPSQCCSKRRSMAVRVGPE